ncbi:AsmA family protein [Marinivivus vitaminiproducens]|uniref:AsmA family protein n=1 Tax=Marinivivus vitaminiproducens TaxID=3035935 RepID=UPI0027A77013|nr:AsmA family protein [Geminicoccaceae bacterium SCSIO 64248]
MRLALKIMGGIVAALLVLIVVAIGALTLVDLNRFKGQIESFAGDLLGRQVQIAGLDVDWSLSPLIHVQGLRIANAEWGQAPFLLDVQDLRARIELLPLVRGHTILPEVSVVAPQASLERNAEGQDNWTLGGETTQTVADEAAVPEDRTELPIVGDLRIQDAAITFSDAGQGVTIPVRLASVEGAAGGPQDMTLTAAGSISEKPFTLGFRGGSADALLAGDEAYPIALEVRLAQTEFSARGGLVQPMSLTGFDLTTRVAGPSASDLTLTPRFPLPDTPPYSLTGQFRFENALWQFIDFAGTFGNSDLRGTAAADLNGEKPLIKAELVSNRLDMADFQPLIGASEEQREATGRVFPDKPLPVEGLDAIDADVRFRGEDIQIPALPMERVETHVVLQDGRAEMRPFSLEAAGGSLNGELAVNTRDEPMSVDAQLTVDSLQLRQLLQGTPVAEDMGGLLQGQLYILASGNSVHQLASTANGHVAAAMTDGRLSGLVVKALGLDVPRTLGFLLTEDESLDLRCLVGGIRLTDGTANLDTMLIDTQGSTVQAQGSVDLGEETMALSLQGRSKESALRLNSPIYVEGSFLDPSIGVGLGIIIPSIEWDAVPDAPCGQTISNVMAMRSQGQE